MVVETKRDADEAYAAIEALRPLVEQMSRVDDEEARIEAMLGQFATVVRRPMSFRAQRGISTVARSTRAGGQRDGRDSSSLRSSE